MSISYDKEGPDYKHGDVSIPVRDILPFLGRCLGSRIKTPDGVGTLIEVKCPNNGLYYTPENASCLMWYGTGNGTGNGWVTKEYPWTIILAGCLDGRTLVESYSGPPERFIDIGKDEHARKDQTL